MNTNGYRQWTGSGLVRVVQVQNSPTTAEDQFYWRCDQCGGVSMRGDRDWAVRSAERHWAKMHGAWDSPLYA
jgi:hypothetical protein